MDVIKSYRMGPFEAPTLSSFLSLSLQMKEEKGREGLMISDSFNPFLLCLSLSLLIGWGQG